MAAQKPGWEHGVLCLSSLMLLFSSIMLAYVAGALTGPRGIWPPRPVHSTERYTLALLDGLEERVEAESLAERIESAFAHVESRFGWSFEGRIRIVASEIIVPAGLFLGPPEAAHEKLGGTSALPWATVVELSAEGLDADTLRHELVHALLRDRGIDPPLALEEGVAYYVGSPDGWNAEFFEILRTQGAPDEFWSTRGESEDSYSLAAGWLVAFYLAEVQGRPLVEIVQRREFPEPLEVFEAVKRFRGAR